MEKLSTKKEFIEALKDLRALEEKAKENYLQDIMQFSNPEIINTLKVIETDEEKHIRIIDDMISLLE